MRKLLSRPKYILLILLILTALTFRILSFGWNAFPHSDVQEDAAASASFLENGRFIIEKYSEGSPEPYHYSIKDKGGRFLIQHPPIWPLMGAGLTYLLGLEPSLENNFFSFKILSLISGIILILLTYILTKRLIGRGAALAIAGWLSFSYLMIDFSANGSFYVLQAASYIIWIMIAMRKNDQHKALYLGIVTGAGYLVNFQFIIIAPASLLILLLEKEKPWLKRFKNVILMSLTALAITTPWLIRNYLLFGDPFYHNYFNMTYVWSKIGLQKIISGDLMYFAPNFNDYISLIKTLLTNWLPHNIYYVARKLFILAPVAFIFFPLAIIDYLFSYERLKRMIPLLLVLTLHFLISTVWPITKFRYFVPLLPLVFIIALDQIYNIKTKTGYRNLIIGLTFASIIFLSFLTYSSTPTHTYYYDGAITTDPFGRQGEIYYLEKEMPTAL